MSNWRDKVGELDPAAEQKIVDYIGHVCALPHLPPKHVEIVLFASSAAVRYRSSMVTHGRRALDLGATAEELFQAGALAALSTGFTTLIETMSVLDELAA